MSYETGYGWQVLVRMRDLQVREIAEKGEAFV